LFLYFSIFLFLVLVSFLRIWILDVHQPLSGAIFEIFKVDSFGRREPSSDIINNGKAFELKDKQMLTIHFTIESYKEYYNSDAEKVSFRI
jgi:hypothetical protein